MIIKYTEDEIIALALKNPKYGFSRFGKILYPSMSRNEFEESNTAFIILNIFSIYRDVTGTDLYDLLQNEDGLERVTEAEYKKITGEKYLRKGAGRGTGGRTYRGGSVQTKMTLPPQKFFWGEIIPENMRTIDNNLDVLDKKMSGIASITNLHYDYNIIWKLWEEGYSRNEISRELSSSSGSVVRIVNQMKEIDKNGIIEEWLEVINIMKWFIKDRGIKTYVKEKNDEIMRFMHLLVDDYIREPVGKEKHDIKELIKIYREISESS